MCVSAGWRTAVGGAATVSEPLRTTNDPDWVVGNGNVIATSAGNKFTSYLDGDR